MVYHALAAGVNMSEVITFQKYNCSSCGANLAFPAGRPFIKCAFCGNKYEVSRTRDGTVEKGASIIPFSVDKERYADAALVWLSLGNYTPDDILTSGAFEDARGTFIPVWKQTGTYQGNWSASSGYNRQEEYREWNDSRKEMVTKHRTVTDWRPSSGQYSGSYRVLAYGGDPDDVPSTALDLVQDVNNLDAGGPQTDLTPGDMGNAALLEFTADPSVSKKSAAAQAVAIIQRDVVSRIPGNQYRDLRYDTAFGPQTFTPLYIPCWMTSYQYSGTKYYLMMSGVNASRIAGTRPVDTARQSVVRRLFYKGHVSAVAAIPLGMFLSSFVQPKSPIPVLIPLALLICCYGIAGIQRYFLLAESKGRRLATLNVIRAKSGPVKPVIELRPPLVEVLRSGSQMDVLLNKDLWALAWKKFKADTFRR